MNIDDFEKAENERLAQAVFRTRERLGEKLELLQTAMKEVDKAYSTMISTWNNYSEKKDANARRTETRNNSKPIEIEGFGDKALREESK